MTRAILLFMAIIFPLLSTACRSQSRNNPPVPAPTSTPTQTSVLAATSTSEPAPATPTPLPPDIIDTLEATPELSSLLSTLRTADLSEKLHSDGPFTLFAPTNAAFAELPADLLQDEEMLLDLLLYHIVAGAVTRQQVAVADTIVPLLGDEAPLRISNENGQVRINDALLPDAAMEVDNGLIYTLDTVLVPPSVQTWTRSRTVQSAAPAENAELPSLFELTEQHPELSTLRDGWRAAGLLEMLEGDGPFTVFAPTDDAFTALVDTASEELLFQLDTEPAPYLLYLIVPAYVPAAALHDGLVLETAQGETIEVRNAASTGAGADVTELYSSTGLTATIAADGLPARNGILHIIDGVLLPELGHSKK